MKSLEKKIKELLIKQSTPIFKQLFKIGFEELDPPEQDTRYGLMKYENYYILYDRIKDIVVGYKKIKK